MDDLNLKYTVSIYDLLLYNKNDYNVLAYLSMSD